MPPSSSQSFYADLPATQDFDRLAGGSGFVPMPDDWTLLVSDVVDSTGAIGRGEYKAVNMVGAASIISVLNACEGLSVPFMFGGDGGVVAVPPAGLKAATTRLAALCGKCPDLFGLELRAAAVPVKALREAGRDVGVQKFRLAGQNMLAMFTGGGIAMADNWLKMPDSNGYALPEGAGGKSLDLTGLSCRWQPLKSLNGVMLTLIVQTSDSRINAAQVGRAFERILGSPLGHFAPVQDENLALEKRGSKSFKLERAALRATMGRYGAWVWTMFTATAQAKAERNKAKVGSYDALEYRQELKVNTDFRKYDGTLRLVIDVSDRQADALETYLKQQAAIGDLTYGVWRSDAALMTCLLFDLEQSLHVHFIDGADGGYTRAAKQMKQA